MVRVGRPSVLSSEFADSDDEEEYGVDDDDQVTVNLEEKEKEKILSSYGIGINRRPRFRSIADTDLISDEVTDVKVVRYGGTGGGLMEYVDQKMQGHVGKILNLVESVNIRLAKMNLKSSQLESSVDQLSESVEWCHGRSHEKLRMLEDILQEVHGTLKDLKDKYEIAETQIKLSKLQVSKNHSPSRKQGSTVNKVVQEVSSVTSYLSVQPVVSPNEAPQVLSAADNNYLSSQNQMLPALTQTPVPWPQNSAHAPEAPYHQQLPTPDTAHGQVMSPYQELHIWPEQPWVSIPQHPHHPVVDNTQPSQWHSHSHPTLAEPQQHSSPVNYVEVQPQSYLSGQLFSQPPNKKDPSQSYMSVAPYPASDSSNHSLPNKHATVLAKHQDVNSYPHSTWRNHKLGHLGPPTLQNNETRSRLAGPPTADSIEFSIPHALPMASFIDDDESSTVVGENRAVTEEADVVYKVSAMGFRRDIVKMTLKNLKENGELVNLNAVLDKLMNEG